MVNNGAVKSITSIDEMAAFVRDNAAAALYFAGANCGVCQVLEPKVQAMLSSGFPRIAFARVAADSATELAAQQSVFAIPTLILFFDGRESFRYVRNFSLAEVERDIARPYGIFFGE